MANKVKKPKKLVSQLILEMKKALSQQMVDF